MANKYSKFLMKMVIALNNYGLSDDIEDTDHPNCPSCGSTMDFHGEKYGLTRIGDGRWECSNCGYSFTEDDLRPYYEKYDEEPWKY